MTLMKPITREETYLNSIATRELSNLPTPRTRVEEYLDYIARNPSVGGTESLKTTPIINNILALTKDKYQKTIMQNLTEIILPTTTEFLEIHLFFDTTADLTLIFPNVKWQATPSIKANKTYEVIFTYVDSWIGGVVSYG